MLLHLQFHLLLKLLALRKHIVVYDLLYILPLCIQLLLDFDDLLVLMPLRLPVILLEEGVADTAYLDTCQDIHYFTLIYFVLVSAYLVYFSPIHMSVLLRKPELVHRYSCVLQVLESSLDLINDDKMVRYQTRAMAP